MVPKRGGGIAARLITFSRGRRCLARRAI